MDIDSEPDDNDNENDNEGGYETDDTEDTIDAENPGEYGEGVLAAYYAEATTTPPPTNRFANANADTSGTPPTRLLTNTQMPGQVYKRVIEQDGTLRFVPFTSDDYRSGEQPFDITGRAINRDQLPHIQPRRLLFGEEKEGGTSKSKSRRRKSKRRRTKKSLRKRKSSRKRKTNKRRKTRSRSKK
jgi:hypothetical protein